MKAIQCGIRLLGWGIHLACDNRWRFEAFSPDETGRVWTDGKTYPTRNQAFAAAIRFVHRAQVWRLLTEITFDWRRSKRISPQECQQLRSSLDSLICDRIH